LMSNMEDVRAAYKTGTRLAAIKMADQVAASAASSASTPSDPTRAAANK
jgi:hypothetical protein